VALMQVEAEYQGKPCKALRIRKPPAREETPAQPQPKPAKADAPKRSRPPRKTLAEELDDEIPYEV
jgi:hypothetical protein